MQRFLAPVCLVLCLGLLVTGFAVLATDSPEPSIQLHGARVSGDEAYEEILERDLQRQTWMRRVLVGALFGAAVVSGIAGFLAIGEPRRP